jgi:hypothetical protein
MHSSLALALSLWTHNRKLGGASSCECSPRGANTSDSDNISPPESVHDAGQQANKLSFSDTKRARMSCMYGLVQASLSWCAGAAPANQELYFEASQPHVNRCKLREAHRIRRAALPPRLMLKDFLTKYE